MTMRAGTSLSRWLKNHFSPRSTRPSLSVLSVPPPNANPSTSPSYSLTPVSIHQLCAVVARAVFCQARLRAVPDDGVATSHGGLLRAWRTRVWWPHRVLVMPLTYADEFVILLFCINMANLGIDVLSPMTTWLHRW